MHPCAAHHTSVGAPAQAWKALSVKDAPFASRECMAAICPRAAAAAMAYSRLCGSTSTACSSTHSAHCTSQYATTKGSAAPRLISAAHAERPPAAVRRASTAQNPCGLHAVACGGRPGKLRGRAHHRQLHSSDGDVDAILHITVAACVVQCSGGCDIGHSCCCVRDDGSFWSTAGW
jgi:hypothetical protein